jgi:hypothetical protein
LWLLLAPAFDRAFLFCACQHLSRHEIIRSLVRRSLKPKPATMTLNFVVWYEP